MDLALAFAIGLLGIAVYFKTKCWSHPAVIFCLFWCVLAGLPIAAVPEANASVMAMSFLFGAAAFFSAPALISGGWSQLRPAPRLSPFRHTAIVWMAVALQIAPIILAALNIERQGFSIIEAVAQPVETACRYLGARYNGHILPTVFSQLGILLNYIGAPLSGIVLATRPQWRVRVPVFILAFVPSLIAVLVYADKGTIFLTTAFILGGVIVGRVSMGSTALMTRNLVLGSAVAAAIIVPVMALALLNRGDGDCSDSQRTSEILTTLTETLTGTSSEPQAVSAQEEHDVAALQDRSSGLSFYIRTYAFSHIFAFSDWFEHYAFGNSNVAYREEPVPTLGFWTFLAIGERLQPDKPIPDGYFDEYFEEPGVLRSNIYTMFRGLIFDFTVPGALVFMAAIGAVANLAYRSMLRMPLAPISQTAYIAVSGFIYSSYLLSVWSWASIYAATLAVAVILLSVTFLWRIKLPRSF